MSVLVRGMKMPRSCEYCKFSGIGGLRNERVVCMFTGANAYMNTVQYLDDCPLVEVPPHGDLIDRDALIKDGWLNLHKEVIRMGGYAIHELPLKNPSIPVIIPAEEGET